MSRCKQRGSRRIPVSLPAAQSYRFAAIALLAVVFAGVGVQAPARAQQQSAASDSAGTTTWAAVHVLGFENAKRNAKGKLTLVGNTVQFEAAKTKAQVSLASVEDVFTDEDNKQVFGGKTGTVAEVVMPYESGRILGLFREKEDVLTLQYQDSSGGFHGAIFRLAKGQAVAVKRRLVAQGVHVTVPVEAAK